DAPARAGHISAVENPRIRALQARRGLASVEPALARGRGVRSVICRARLLRTLRTLRAGGRPRMGGAGPVRPNVRPSGPALTWARAWAARAIGTLRVNLVHRELAVAVPVELLERFRGVGDFIRVNDAIAVGIEHGQKRRGRRTLA